MEATIFPGFLKHIYSSLVQQPVNICPSLLLCSGCRISILAGFAEVRLQYLFPSLSPLHLPPYTTLNIYRGSVRHSQLKAKLLPHQALHHSAEIFCRGGWEQALKIGNSSLLPRGSGPTGSDCGAICAPGQCQKQYNN